MGKKLQFMESFRDLLELYGVHSIRICKFNLDKDSPDYTKRALTEVTLDSDGEKIKVSVEELLEFCKFENPYKEENT